MKQITGYDIDDALDLLGLTRKTSLLGALLPAVALLSVGAAIGAGVGLAFAPSSGTRLRKEFGERLDQIRERMKFEMKNESHSPRGAINAVAHQS
jgi:gas vesicle protein